jgi:hypothetical protein
LLLPALSAQATLIVVIAEVSVSLLPLEAIALVSLALEDAIALNFLLLSAMGLMLKSMLFLVTSKPTPQWTMSTQCYL